MNQPDPQPPAPQRPRADWALGLIVGAVLLWGVYLAVGATLKIRVPPGASAASASDAAAAPGTRIDLRKGLIVLVMVVAFLGGWGGLLFWRRHRLHACEARDRAEAEQAPFPLKPPP